MVQWFSSFITTGLDGFNSKLGAGSAQIQQYAQTTSASLQRASSTIGSSGGGTVAESGVQVNPSSPQTTALGKTSTSFENLDDAQGRRVRLRAKPGGAAKVYGDGIMSPLLQTKGMVFPYQPLITYQQDVVYDTMQLVHTNQDIYSYTRTPALKLTVDGDFTVQNQREGLYALACIHFLRTVTKMWFGGSSAESIENQGTPPPVLLFDAYGQYMFNSLPVVITQFSVSLPNDVDYVPVLYQTSSAVERKTVQSINSSSLSQGNKDGYAWLPAAFKIGVQITVQNTPQRLRQFDMTEFRSGRLLKQGGWA